MHLNSFLSNNLTFCFKLHTERRLQNGEGGQVKFYTYKKKKGGGGEKVPAILRVVLTRVLEVLTTPEGEGGHRRFPSFKGGVCVGGGGGIQSFTLS